MTRKNDAHDMVMESITEALLKLMEKKPLAEINITELCRRAGVSRVSFYRNYSSMHDILVRYLTRCTDEWWNEFSKKPQTEFYETFWIELLGQYKSNEKLIRLLYENNASNLIKEHVFSCCKPEHGLNEQDSFIRAALAGALYGLVDEWIRRGMGDFPADFSLQKILKIMPYQEAVK